MDGVSLSTKKEERWAMAEETLARPFGMTIDGWKLANGADVILHEQIPAVKDDVRFEIVLAKWGMNEMAEFVVWHVNPKDNSAHWGHYYEGTAEGLRKAILEFEETLKRYR